jgi:hypothetical protein
LRSVYERPELVKGKIKKEVSLGWVAGPFTFRTKFTSNKVVYIIVGWMGQMMYHAKVTIFLVQRLILIALFDYLVFPGDFDQLGFMFDD